MLGATVTDGEKKPERRDQKSMRKRESFLCPCKNNNNNNSKRKEKGGEKRERKKALPSFHCSFLLFFTILMLVPQDEFSKITTEHCQHTPSVSCIEQRGKEGKEMKKESREKFISEGSNVA